MLMSLQSGLLQTLAHSRRSAAQAAEAARSGGSGHGGRLLVFVLWEALLRHRVLQTADTIHGRVAVTSVSACDEAAQCWLSAHTVACDMLASEADSQDNSSSGETREAEGAATDGGAADDGAASRRVLESWLACDARDELPVFSEVVAWLSPRPRLQQLRDWVRDRHEAAVSDSQQRRQVVQWPAC